MEGINVNQNSGVGEGIDKSVLAPANPRSTGQCWYFAAALTILQSAGRVRRGHKDPAAKLVRQIYGHPPLQHAK